MMFKHKIEKRVNRERRKREEEAKKREKISQSEEEEAQERGEIRGEKTTKPCQ